MLTAGDDWFEVHNRIAEWAAKKDLASNIDGSKEKWLQACAHRTRRKDSKLKA